MSIGLQFRHHSASTFNFESGEMCLYQSLVLEIETLCIWPADALLSFYIKRFFFYRANWAGQHGADMTFLLMISSTASQLAGN